MAITAFTQAVYTAVQAIPKGEIRTYQQVAAAAGRPRAFRAVGTILRRNTDKNVPCHRVIKSDGSLGRYNGLRGTKRALLKTEKAI